MENMSYLIWGILVMGLVTLFCRAFPFILMRYSTISKDAPLLKFIERSVPPVAMTVLAFASIISPLKVSMEEALKTLIATGVTVGVHLWKRNPLLSIAGGTLVYIILKSINMQ
jgi:branched-subunit amino acid transport protein AzlD